MTNNAKYGRYSKVIREQQEHARALVSVADRFLAQKDEEIEALTKERDRYKAALEVIAGSSADKLHAIQAKNALDNIGPSIVHDDRQTTSPVSSKD